MSLLDLSTATSPDHWRYLAEGGDTIVYSYIGPPDERFLNKVLRVRKDRPEKTEDQDITVSFHTEIIPRLVPHDYLVDIETISLRRSWLETLYALSVHSRPAWRTDSIDFSRTNALLVPNLVSSPISIEIKPKWSFIKDGTAHTCRFCMHASCRGWSTTYCPLDLFSNSPVRVKKALYALYDFWADTATQNNLRLFAGGNVVSSGNLLSTLQQLGILQSSIREEELRDLVVETLHASLVQTKSSSLLKILNRLQRTLGGIGIEGLASLWNDVYSITEGSSPSFGEGCLQPTLDDWYSFVAEYQSVHSSQEQPSSESKDGQKKLQYHILSYLLSATFKDCSIMIMLPGLLNQNIPASSFPSRIVLVDLGPKPVRRLQKWLDQDRDIMQGYAELVGKKETEKKECVDDWCISK